MPDLRPDGSVGPIHPGEVLAEDFLKSLNITAYHLAQAIAVPASRIHRIVRGVSPITIDTALRLARFFGTTPELWLGLQTHHDLDLARETLARQIEAEVMPLSA